jgi:hypothetical protein
MVFFFNSNSCDYLISINHTHEKNASNYKHLQVHRHYYQNNSGYPLRHTPPSTMFNRVHGFKRMLLVCHML